MRSYVGKVLGLNAEALEAHHAASPWRFGIVREVQHRAQDPDIALCQWLEHGAPMGLSRDFENKRSISRSDREP
jgi:hypothetical protein